MVVALVWMGCGIGLFFFLIAAVKKRDDKVCKGLNVEVMSPGKQPFADKNDIRGMIRYMNIEVEGAPMLDIDLRKIEEELEKNPWIRNAELFFDNNEVLQVRITERKPIARVFTRSGKTFYVDDQLVRLPLSNRFSAAVPVFTGCPLDRARWNAEDSTVLLQVKAISEFISADAFWAAQVAQIDHASKNRFEIIPMVGDHRIILGDTNRLEEKFFKLFVFYKEVLARTGWNRYRIIDVRFKEQVVATKNETNRS